ncbi:MAG: N-acetylmuramoyl-L-alanine amidase [Chthoniobacterales bacterium]
MALHFGCWLAKAETTAASTQSPQILVAELSDDEKKRLFLKARQDIHLHASPTPTPHHSKPKPAPSEDETSAPKPKPTEHPQTERPHVEHPEHAQVKKSHPQEAPEKPKPKSEPAPKATPAPVAPPTKSANLPPAPVVIEKSGISQEEGYVAPAPQSSSFFFGPRYRYLTPSVRREIDKAHVLRGRWKYIVVHNSGTRQGNAHAFDIYHRTVRKMPNGLAYHFVIGDGHGSGDGEIEIGNRWKQQINGGHVASDYLNNIALGICLVGDFNRDRPTAAQEVALDELIVYLRKRVGKFSGKPSTVVAHKEINPRPTDCPGTHFPYRWLHQTFK